MHTPFPTLWLLVPSALSLGACKKEPLESAAPQGLQHLVERWIPLCQPANASTGGSQGEEIRKSSWLRAGFEAGLSLAFHCLEEPFLRQHLMTSYDFGQEFSGALLGENPRDPTAKNSFVALKCSAWFDDSFDGRLAFFNPQVSALRQKRYCVRADERGCRNLFGQFKEECRVWPVVRFVPKSSFQRLNILNMRTRCTPWTDPRTVRLPAEYTPFPDDPFRYTGHGSLIFFSAVRSCKYAIGISRNIFSGQALEYSEVLEFAQFPGEIMRQAREETRRERMPAELAMPTDLARHRGAFAPEIEQKSNRLKQIMGEIGSTFVTLLGIPVETWFQESQFATMEFHENLGAQGGTTQVFCSKWYDDFLDGSFDFVTSMTIRGEQAQLRQKRFCTARNPGALANTRIGSSLKTFLSGMQILLKKELPVWPVFRWVRPEEHSVLGTLEKGFCTAPWEFQKGCITSAGKNYCFTAQRTCLYNWPELWLRGGEPSDLTPDGLTQHNGAKWDPQTMRFLTPTRQFPIKEYASFPID